MKVEVYEVDPFTQRKDKLLTTLDSEFRFQKGDEITIDEGGGRQKVRVSYVMVRIRDGAVEQELQVMRI